MRFLSFNCIFKESGSEAQSLKKGSVVLEEHRANLRKKSYYSRLASTGGGEGTQKSTEGKKRKSINWRKCSWQLDTKLGGVKKGAGVIRRGWKRSRSVLRKEIQ